MMNPQSDSMIPDHPQSRVVISGIDPEIDLGRYPVKRLSGDRVTVSANVFCDGHDPLRVFLEVIFPGQKEWNRFPMEDRGNDRWSSSFLVGELGVVRFRIIAWIDLIVAFSDRIAKKAAAGHTEETDYAELIIEIQKAADRADPVSRTALEKWTERLSRESDPGIRLVLATDSSLVDLGGLFPDPVSVAHSREDRTILVERERAAVGAWYEFFPRNSAWGERRHATFQDAIKRLPEIRQMGFDVVYPGPVHPIGYGFRKGKNNAPECGPGDVGSPWAIGSDHGGHTAIHPDLGSIADFEAFVFEARSLGIEVAMELALQCSPDHPYVREHPGWFRMRPDGSIHYAENPPKKYQDIYPFDFHCADWKALWQEILGVLLFWGEKGIRLFRVDNPHTKPFAFWEWLLSTVRKTYPDMVFLSEAFTRPNVMYELAKIGFSQSYTYFTWRITKAELIDYVTELTTFPVKEFFRPNFWPNTPDILHDFLQRGGLPAFVIRLVLAATLSSSYGIFGPSYERCDATVLYEGGEEYLDSEKYEIRLWDPDPPVTIRETIARINGIRNQYPALHRNEGVQFLSIEEEFLLAYLKPGVNGTPDILVIVNLDPYNRREGLLSYAPFGSSGSFSMKNLMDGTISIWEGETHRVVLDPQMNSFLIFSREGDGKT